MTCLGASEMRIVRSGRGYLKSNFAECRNFWHNRVWRGQRPEQEPLNNKTDNIANATATVPVEFTWETFIAKLGMRDRTNALKRLAAMEAGPQPALAPLWKSLCELLMSNSGHSAILNSKQSVQFFAADGKYRMQIFALQDDLPGEVIIYAPDVVEKAVTKKIIRKPRATDAKNLYRLGDNDQTLTIDQLNGDGPEHPPFFKDLMSWKRKCMRISIPVPPSPEQMQALIALVSILRK